MLRNWIKFPSYFVACICVWMKFCCWHWKIIPALLRLLLMVSCGMLLGLVSTFMSRWKVIEYILFQKTIQNTTQKIERPEDWYEIDENWRFLWDFLWISEQYIVYTHLSRLSLAKKHANPQGGNDRFLRFRNLKSMPIYL